MSDKASTSKRNRMQDAAGSQKRRRSSNRESSKEAIKDDVEVRALPMGKALASTEKSVRDKAIRSLADYMSQSNAEPLTDLEMARLWKGIFYCFWMSDKPRVQQTLAQEIADIVLSIDASDKKDSGGAMRFLEGFFDAMVREWWGLDKWRVDKFMMLVRRFVGAGLRLLVQRDWQRESIERLTSMLTKEGGVLDTNNVKTPHGLLYHFCDVYLEELEKACQSCQKDFNVPVTSLLTAFISTVGTCHARLHYDRIFKSVLTPMLEDCLAAEKGLARSDGDEAFARCQYPALMQRADKSPAEVRKEIFAALFKQASQPTSAEARRRQIYKLVKEEQDRLDDD